MFPNGPPLPFPVHSSLYAPRVSAVNAFRWEIDEKWINYSQFKKKIRHRAEILEKTIRELEGAGMAEGPAAERWRAYLGGIGESLRTLC